MKNIILITISIITTISCQAQYIESSDLEKYSKEISSSQLTVDGKNYIDTKDNQVYIISFPDDNFNVLFGSKLAYRAVYKKENSEILAITEGIDLKKVTSIAAVRSPIKTTANAIRLSFPAGYLKTKIIEDGEIKKTVNDSYLDFFYADEETKIELIRNLNALVALIKKGDRPIKMNTNNVKEPKTIDPFIIALQQARAFYNDNDWDNAQKFYSEALGLKDDAKISDTIDLINNFINYDATILKANQQKKAAAASFNLDEVNNANQKISICQATVKLYERAIEFYKDALQIQPSANAPKLLISDCRAEINRIKAQEDKFATEQLATLYKRAKTRGDAAKEEKDYRAALKAYQEALTYIQDEKLQKVMYNHVGELDYINAMIRIMRDQTNK